MHATVTRLSYQSDEGVEAAEAALRRVIDGLPATLGVRDCNASHDRSRGGAACRRHAVPERRPRRRPPGLQQPDDH